MTKFNKKQKSKISSLKNQYHSSFFRLNIINTAVVTVIWAFTSGFNCVTLRSYSVMWATPGWSCCPRWRTNGDGDIAEGKLPLPNLAGHTNDTGAYTPERHFKSRWGRYSPRLQFSVIPQSQLFQGMTDLWDYKIVLSLIFRFASLFLFWAPT